jgi:fructose-1,6-bisphosphatase/inositol monophosphatase family enzyme
MFLKIDSNLIPCVDQEVERMIKSQLHAKFPSYVFVGEESVAGGEHSTLTDQPTIICDPVDGTTNFVSGFPFVCISLALVVNQVSQVGIVYNPILDELYVSHRGCGAWMNGQALPFHHRSALCEKDSKTGKFDFTKILLITEAGHDRSEPAMSRKISTWDSLLAQTKHNIRGFRATGSGALDLCMIARGSADVYWEIGPHAWDMAAGILLVEEAGGMVLGEEYLNESNRPAWNSTTKFDLFGRKVFAMRTKELEFMESFVPLFADWVSERD